MTAETIRLKLHIWRQKSPSDEGQFETHEVAEASTHSSFLELLDQLNERLITELCACSE